MYALSEFYLDTTLYVVFCSFSQDFLFSIAVVVLLNNLNFGVTLY